MTTTLETWSPEEFCSVIRLLLCNISNIEIRGQLLEAYGNGVGTVQLVRKLSNRRP
jgi:hypothetical protein